MSKEELIERCVYYSLQQVETSRVSVLDDEANDGYDSQEYYEMQVAALQQVLSELQE